jgi:hypothetical protein
MKKRLTLCLAAICFADSASLAHASDPSEYVYVESNIGKPNANSIFAFKRQSDGSLIPVSGSPFLTSGAGVIYTGTDLGPFDSDQEIITNAQQTLLFAVNAGSNSIAVFHISDSGALTPVDGSPFPSGGDDPVSLGIYGDTLFVVNQSGDFAKPSSVLPNYTSMHIEPDGILVPINDHSNDTLREFQTTISVAAGSSPSQAYIVPGKNLLIGDYFLGGLLQSFHLNDMGEMFAQPAIALPASEFNDTTTPRFPLGLWSNPVAPVLYAGYVTANKIGVYRYSADGDLTFLRTVPNAGQGICWIRSNRAGTRLYTTDTATNQVSVYDTSDPEYPVEIQTFTLEGAGNAFQLSLSEDGRHLYAISQHGNLLHSLIIQSDGTVAEATAVKLPEPTGARPQGIAVVEK